MLSRVLYPHRRGDMESAIVLACLHIIMKINYEGTFLSQCQWLADIGSKFILILCTVCCLFVFCISLHCISYELQFTCKMKHGSEKSKLYIMFHSPNKALFCLNGIVEADLANHSHQSNNYIALLKIQTSRARYNVSCFITFLKLWKANINHMSNFLQMKALVDS